MNPYAPPEAALNDVVPGPDLSLAARSTRFVAALIDGVIWWFAPMSFTAISSALRFRIVDEDPATGIPGLFIALWFFVLTVCWLWLLTTRGQTPGKRLLGIEIVTLDGSRASFGAVIIRTVLPLLLDILPGFMLLDPLFILRRDRRCLHDLIAGTKVVVVPKLERVGATA